MRKPRAVKLDPKASARINISRCYLRGQTRALLHRDLSRLNPASSTNQQPRVNIRENAQRVELADLAGWKIIPPPLPTPRGPTNAPSLPPFPESVSANPRCLQFRPLPPPFGLTQALHIPLRIQQPAREFSPTHAKPHTQPWLPSSKSAGRSADPCSFGQLESPRPASC